MGELEIEDGARTLSARLSELDSRRFVGRVAELATLERCLEPDPPFQVVLVHGPGGIGKSTLLREFGRRARGRGFELFALEGRDITPTPDGIESLLAPARDSARPLITIDTFEKVAGLAGYLRRGLLPSLPESAVVVIAGRGDPDARWFEGSWEGLVVEFELTTMAPGEAAELLAAQGVDDDRTEAIVAWAEGSPLALALAADAAGRDSGWLPQPVAQTPELLRPMIRRLIEDERGAVRWSALAVAATARVTTRELLQDVLPDGGSDEGFAQLQRLSFTEPLADGLTLHELVRRALRADLKLHEPDRERDLRRRIVDHLYRRASDGEPLLVIDMADLIEDAVIRRGFGWRAARTHRLDDVWSSDIPEIAAQMQERGLGDLWPLAERFFLESPEHVAVVRDSEHRPQAYLVCVSQRHAPAWVEQDPILGPWLELAQRESAGGDSVLWHSSVDLSDDPRAGVKSMLGMGGVLRCGVANPRYAYLPTNPAMPNEVEFARVLGAEHLAWLDFASEHNTIQCHRLDYGPGGLLAAIRRQVYAETGLAPDGVVLGGIDGEVVRDALRNFRLPHELARSPLATGTSPEERAESVRELLRRAAERGFGDTDNERLLQRVLIHGYFDSVPSHEQAALDLSLSRAAYFRRLRVAVERVAATVASDGVISP
ncbi:MAG TPA: ATP-binding protein [Solirubrobacteraceae bacterium]|nr:ATP-binding protein [Solirubrobacteraceae bacterium]